MQKVNAAAWRAKEFRWCWPRCDDVRRGELALCGLDWLRAENLSPRECPLFPACPRLSKLQTARITLELLNGMPSSLPACKLILSIVSAAQVFLYCFVIVKLHLTQPCKVETLFKANIKWSSPCIVCQAFAMNQSTEYFLDYIGKLIGSDAEASRKEPPAGLSSGISSIRIWVSEDSNFDRLCQLQVNSNKNNSKFGWSFLFNKLKKPFRGVFQKVRSLWKKFKR